ncbi:retrovirus-related pol polyprotein from transposon TNT 1-94 [Tanacetum coccineum]
MATKLEIEKFNGNTFSLLKLNDEGLSFEETCLAPLVKGRPRSTDDINGDEMDESIGKSSYWALADGVLSSIEEKKTAREIWDHLARLYEARTLHNKNISLKETLKLFALTESTSPLTEGHFNNLNTLFSQLTSLDCKIDPQERAEILLQSLPDSYDQVIINLTSNVLTDCLVFDDVAASVLVTRGRSMEPGSSGSHNHGKSKTGKKKKFKCFKCGKHGHFKKDCRGSNTSNPQENVASTSDDGNALCCEAAVANEGRKKFADVWLFDTGATFHMTARREWFHQYKPISGGGYVYSCNDHELKIIGIGSIMVKMHDGTVRTIRDVRHVEGLKKNLLSLGQLDDLGCKVEIQNKIMKIIKGALVLMRGEKVAANLYQLKGEIICAVRAEEGGAVREVCKQHRLKFKASNSRSVSVLELVHFDVWQAPVLSLGGANDGFELILGTKIKCLRTDNGGEYTGDEFDLFCKQEGIKRHSLYITLLQQNGVVERMNKTLLEKAKAIKGVRLWDPTAPQRCRQARCSLMERQSSREKKKVIALQEKLQQYRWKKVERHRARLVVKGYAQKEGIDFNEIFPLVVRITTIRVVLAMCATYDLHLEQLDVNCILMEILMKKFICSNQKTTCRPLCIFQEVWNNDFVILLLYVGRHVGPGPNKDVTVNYKAQLASIGKVVKRDPLDKLKGTSDCISVYGEIGLTVKRSVVAMSTTEAEYVAAAQASKEAVWLKMLLEELGHEQEKITLFCDNQSALYLARNPAFHSKTKHNNDSQKINYFVVRESGRRNR